MRRQFEGCWLGLLVWFDCFFDDRLSRSDRQRFLQQRLDVLWLEDGDIVKRWRISECGMDEFEGRSRRVLFERQWR